MHAACRDYGREIVPKHDRGERQGETAFHYETGFGAI